MIFVPAVEVWRRYGRANTMISIFVNGRRYKGCTLKQLFREFNDTIIWRDVISQIENALNIYFGNLTYHKIEKFTSSSIMLICKGCSMEDNKAKCDAHIGITQGIMEALWGTSYEHKVIKDKEKKICCMILFKKDAKEEI